MVMRGGSREREKIRDWDLHRLITIYKITNKDLSYITGNITQYSVLAYMGKDSKKSGYMYMYN